MDLEVKLLNAFVTRLLQKKKKNGSFQNHKEY